MLNYKCYTLISLKCILNREAITNRHTTLYYLRLSKPVAQSIMKWAAVLLALACLHLSTGEDYSDIPHFPYGYTKCKNPGTVGLHCGDFDLPVNHQDVNYDFCKCRCGDIAPLEVEDLFHSSANCVLIKPEGEGKNPGGYMFTMDNFDAGSHSVYHDLWFKKNKKQRTLPGSYWRIYYPWVNASSKSDTVPFAVQNIQHRQFLTVTANAFQKNWKTVETVPKLTQKGMWNFELKKVNGRTIWSMQNKKTLEFLIMHSTATADHWWQGRILAHDKKKWDGFPAGNYFYIHPCF